MIKFRKLTYKKFVYLLIIAVLVSCGLIGCRNGRSDLEQIFNSPPEQAKPWVYWYWMYAGISQEGITADLEAMKENGIGGAYIFFIYGVSDPPQYSPPAEQLTSEWWDMVRFAFSEANRLGLKLGLHSCDGFAVAGGPWITPELSMQKIVWTETHVKGDYHLSDTIKQPESFDGYYSDIAVFAFPTPEGSGFSTVSTSPKVTSSLSGIDAQCIAVPGNTKVFRSDKPCWIQYEFNEPFTCRSVVIRTDGLNLQSNRLIIESGNDGINFTPVCRLEPPRHGWQDYEASVTHSIPPTRAKYFRFLYNKEGSEPGAEDLEAAKWNPALKITGIELSGKPCIHQYEGKNGSIWRISKSISGEQLADTLCVPIENIMDITSQVDPTGHIEWDVPPGDWTILRIGHTSTGKTNYTGGGGMGLECDKFNPEVVQYQFEQWFGKFYEEIGPELTTRVLKIFHVDSWECGSQNWSPVFRAEFKQHRGYDIYQYLPAMTGIPVQSAEVSERFLYDVRLTIAELISDNFFGTLARLSHEKGCIFSAECVAPVMTSDDILHFKNVDIPMGEFWFNSPTHDKPNDIQDAVSGAHIYGKQIVQAESFTTLRMNWEEHPAMLKTTGDLNFAQGINRLVFHVFTHNPWEDKKPGMTLSDVGLLFQRDQSWWKPGRAWIEYITRCQALLQQGIPVTDIAVFVGEEIPVRAILPDRLIHALPGLFGKETIENEKIRMANTEIPMQEKPHGVTNSANTYDPVNWPDPLLGYKFDSFNRDVLLRLAEVKNGKIVLPGGSSYSFLVIAGTRKMAPDNRMSLAIAEKILELATDGASIIVTDAPEMATGLNDYEQTDSQLQEILDKIFQGNFGTIQTPAGTFNIKTLGKGHIIKGPVVVESLEGLDLERDFIAFESSGSEAQNIAWTHRNLSGTDIYFITNQCQADREIKISLRVERKVPEIFDPMTGEVTTALNWKITDRRTVLPVQLSPAGSLFIVLQKSTKSQGTNTGKNWIEHDTLMKINGPWHVQFNPAYGGPEKPVIMNEPDDWTLHPNDSIQYYSGTAVYFKTVKFQDISFNNRRIWIDLGRVSSIAEVTLNNVNCGVAWTLPFRVEITNAIKKGNNELRIAITNTWKNRLIYDHGLSVDERITWTNAPYRLDGQTLSPSGLLGSVVVIYEKR